MGDHSLLFRQCQVEGLRQELLESGLDLLCLLLRSKKAQEEIIAVADVT
jgi:hypothetical protein